MAHTADFPIFIDPPDTLVQYVPRLELREALRVSKKFGKPPDDADAYLYASESEFFLEVGTYRRSFPLDGSWYGCTSLRADLLMTFWNTLPKGDRLPVRYERGWLCLGTLAVGRAVWQPKYDPQWMCE